MVYYIHKYSLLGIKNINIINNKKLFIMSNIVAGDLTSRDLTSRDLAKVHKHPRDALIEFFEGPHLYFVNGQGGYTSVTTFIKALFEKFDSELIVSKMMNGKRWQPGHKYWGMTGEEIKAKWAQDGKVASLAGTKMHEDIEFFYNGLAHTRPENNSLEYSYFMNFVKDHAGLTPYRTEWMVWDDELMLAGSIDFIAQVNGEYIIYDWKRSKKIEKTSGWDKWCLDEDISHLPDTNFWHYSLQLNIYKYILEKNYGIQISHMYLVCLHPDNVRGNYELHKVSELGDEVDVIMKKRLSLF